MQLMRQSVGHVLSYKMLSSPHLASPSAVQTPPTGVSASAAKNKGMDNYKQGKYADAIKWLSWAVILLEKTCDGAASMEVLSRRASCYKEVGEYKKAVVDCTKWNYNVCLPHNKIPDALCQLAKKMAAPAMPGGEEFRPEAAIVNYFGLAFFYCEVDGSSLCLQYDMIVHVGGKRTHERYLVLRQRIEFPGDKPGRMEDPTENRRGENQQLGLTMGENQQNHRVPESATNANADGHANTKTNMMDLNMQPHQIHEQASNNQNILVVSKYY